MMKKINIILVSLLLLFTLVSCEKTKTIDPPEEEICYAPDDYPSDLTYELVWSDEFNGDSLNLDDWNIEENGYGGGNNELQYYKDENVTLEDGHLVIKARKESFANHDYTSGRINTKYNQYFKYGIFEIRAKLPSGKGTWPAGWLLPEFSSYGTWPNSGEIDIFEHVGYEENVIHGTVHTESYNHNKGTQKGGQFTDFSDVTSEFHTYKIEWLPNKIIFYIDDIEYYTYDHTKFVSCAKENIWPFNRSFFIILNVAIGGDWGGAQGIDDTIFPTEMRVDYVRVYQANELDNYDDHTE